MSRMCGHIGPGKIATYREAALYLPNRCGTATVANSLDAFISPSLICGAA
jgi:hypothetical protein